MSEAAEARAHYEAIYAEWLNAQKLAAMYRTTADRLESELSALAVAEQQRTGHKVATLEPDNVFGPRKE